MSISRREKDFTYFTFDHSRQYQRMHRQSMLTVAQRMEHVILSVEDVQRNLHVEGLIEVRLRA